MSKKLVAYFSASGTTKKAAEMVAKAAGADLYEIKPKTAYTKADLNWMDKKSRSSVEMADKKIRPELADTDADIAAYDEILIGFPIWWYDLPMPVWSFLEEYDLSGKTIIPFFTHNGSSSGASSVSTVAELCPDPTVLIDDYFTYSGNNVDEAESDVDEWLTELGYKN